MTSEASTVDPVRDAGFAGAVCPDCGHDDAGRRGWFQRLFKTAAFCPRHQNSEESGVGMPGECSCTNGFHS